MNGDPRTRTLVRCAQCGNGHWLPDRRLIQEGGETFCSPDCRDRRRDWRRVEDARGTDAFPAVVAAVRRDQEARHARFLVEQAERRTRLEAELAAVNAAWEARPAGRTSPVSPERESFLQTAGRRNCYRVHLGVGETREDTTMAAEITTGTWTGTWMEGWEAGFQAGAAARMASKPAGATQLERWAHDYRDSGYAGYVTGAMCRSLAQRNASGRLDARSLRVLRSYYPTTR